MPRLYRPGTRKTAHQITLSCGDARCARHGDGDGPRSVPIVTGVAYRSLVRFRTSRECTTRSVLASCEARSASASTPSAIASPKTNQVSSDPLKIRAAISDHTATRAMIAWPKRYAVFLASAALAAAMTAIPADTPNAVHPAVPADQAMAATVRNVPATT